MNLEDVMISPPKINSENWQLGNVIGTEIKENGIVFIFCSDYRGVGGKSDQKNFDKVREEFYKLSRLDFNFSISDLGDIISGKSLEDTHYILQEILLLCLNKNSIPVIIGGGNDLAYSLLKTLALINKDIRYAQINNKISLSNEGETISEQNFLQRIFHSSKINIKDYYHLGYQKHLSDPNVVDIMKEMDFEMVRLSEMMNDSEKIEPFFRKTDVVTINCDAIESFGEAFSVMPQVNGLNRREICAYAKEIGLSENLKMLGIFNFNIHSENILNHQLLAQTLWYFLEGVSIQKSHPKEKKFETFFVLVDDYEYAFKRDAFSGLWYFGSHEDIEKCLPCSRDDYEMAKKGILNKRFLKS